MSERTAKAARRVAGPEKPKQFFKAMTVPMKSGEVDEEGKPIMVDTYIPRQKRRKLVRMFLADYRKGRLPQQVGQK